ncbi:MAG: hypothetical protein IAG13_29940, partial [Deltaproteobacteria bacterium]|nr:hypothetical protein [Nannocystaceae bacterium]
WASVLLFTVSCVGVGHLLLRRVFRVGELLLAETWLSSMAVGMACFVVAIYAAGAVGAFHPALSLLLPAACIGASYRDIKSLAVRTFLDLTAPSEQTRVVALIRKAATIWAFIGLGVIYLIALTPDTISLDSAWYHLPVAHDYVRAGRLIPFPSEYNRAFPQMNSIVYTWAFLLPGITHPLDWMLALHIDYSMIIWKAIGVAAGVEYLLGDRRVRGIWTGFFLFPMVFTFANAVTAGPEHISGFWAIPLFLATARMLKDFSLRWAALLGVISGGAILSRYQSVYMIAACGSMIMARWGWLLYQRGRGRPTVDLRRLWQGPLLVIGLGLLVSSPHFIKNIVFYGDPVYPFMMSVLPGSHPSHPEAVSFFKSTLGDPGNRPKFHGFERISAAFRIFFTFSFQPHHVVVKQDWPIFGSLFTLLMPCVAFIRSPGRILLGIYCCFVVIAVWCNLYLQTRYLNTASTIFAATGLALMVRVWELGRSSRVALSLLVMFQVIWQGDAATYSGDEPITSSIKLIRSGWAGELEPEARYPYWRGFAGITAATPEDAQILVRGPRTILGLDRFCHRDVQSQQGNFYYAPLRNSAELWQHYRERGITHLVHKRNSGYAGTLQSAVLYADLVTRQAMPVQSFGAWQLVELSPTPPIAPEDFVVAVIGVRSGYPDGVFDVRDLTLRGKLDRRRPDSAKPTKLAKTKQDVVRLAKDAHVLVVGPDAPKKELKVTIDSGFTRFEEINDVVIYVKKG